MLKFLILIGFVVLVQSVDVEEDVNEECEITIADRICKTSPCKDRSSTACQFTANPNFKCTNEEILPLNKNDIVSVHNELRNNIAIGNLEGYESASDIAELEWNDDLAKMAEYNVKTCVHNHDACIKLAQFPLAGQNYHKASSSMKYPEYDSVITKGIRSWYKESLVGDMKLINSFYMTTKVTGHFTQVVKNKATKVGCSASRWMSASGWDNVYFVCNYGYGNLMKSPVYTAGPVASKCTKVSEKYPGLCALGQTY